MFTGDCHAKIIEEDDACMLCDQHKECYSRDCSSAVYLNYSYKTKFISRNGADIKPSNSYVCYGAGAAKIERSVAPFRKTYRTPVEAIVDMFDDSPEYAFSILSSVFHLKKESSLINSTFSMLIRNNISECFYN